VRNKTHLDDRYGPLERVDKRVYGDNVLDFYGLGEPAASVQDEKEESKEEE